jgi:hypothetical protein
LRKIRSGMGSTSNSRMNNLIPAGKNCRRLRSKKLSNWPGWKSCRGSLTRLSRELSSFKEEEGLDQGSPEGSMGQAPDIKEVRGPKE